MNIKRFKIILTINYQSVIIIARNKIKTKGDNNMRKLFTAVILTITSLVGVVTYGSNNFNFKEHLIDSKNYDMFGIDLYSSARDMKNNLTDSCFKNIYFTKKQNKVEKVDGDFRQGLWGESLEVVAKREPQLSVNKEYESISGYDKIMGLDMYLTYCFVDDKLYRGIYSLEETYDDKNEYVRQYERLVEGLNSVYGTSQKEEVIWSTNIYDRNNKEDYGMAVATGGAKFRTRWILDEGETEIAIYLVGEGFDCQIMIAYESATYSKLYDERNEMNNSNTAGL